MENTGLISPVVMPQEADLATAEVVGVTSLSEQGRKAMRLMLGSLGMNYLRVGNFHRIAERDGSLGLPQDDPFLMASVGEYLGIRYIFDHIAGDEAALKEAVIWHDLLTGSAKLLLAGMVSERYAKVNLERPRMIVIPRIPSTNLDPDLDTLVMGKQGNEGPGSNKAAFMECIAQKTSGAHTVETVYYENVYGREPIVLPAFGKLLIPKLNEKDPTYIFDDSGWNPFVNGIPAHLGWQNVLRFRWSPISSLRLAETLQK